ncbi:hypothetical protein ACWDE9_42005, partial [Streptomyces olivaceoviridis]
VFFCNSGAEANEAAFKIGRLTGRTHMVATDGAPSHLGTYGWTGVATTAFWVDPAHDLTVQFMSQVRPKRLKVFPELRRLVHAAVTD